MSLEQDAAAQREFAQQLASLPHRGPIILNLPNVFTALRVSGFFPGLELEHLAHRCLRTLDLGRQNGFLGRKRR